MMTLDSRWRSIDMNDEQRAKSSNYYYPEFVDFCFGANKNTIHRFVLPVESTIAVKVGWGNNIRSVTTTVADVTLYQAPFGMCLFAIRVDMEACDNDITAVISRLRAIDSLTADNKDFTTVALDPIMEVYRANALSVPDVAALEKDDCYYRLVEYGNKLKVFQIAVVDGKDWSCDSSDKLLFELGTLAPIGSYNPEDDFSSSKSYFDKIMQDGKVSVFNNWKALSLFDTFTMLGHHISDGNVANWIDNYFGMLYVSELFVKFYLFRLNNDFRISHKRADKLLSEFDDFEYSCWFDNVSYNFLPRLIHRSMEQGLEILGEKQRLYQMIAQQKDNREKRDDQRMNNLLFYLTLFTTFSMIWDASSLFNEMYPYETYVGSNIEGFRLVSYSLMLIVFALIMAIRFKKR